jgi:hypothetical protein
VRIEAEAGPTEGGGGGWIAKLDIKADIGGIGAEAEGWAKFWAIEVDVEAAEGVEAKGPEGTLKGAEEAGGRFIAKVEIKAEAERGAGVEETLEGAGAGLEGAEETLEEEGVGLEEAEGILEEEGVGLRWAGRVEAARFAEKAEERAEIGGGAEIVGVIWKEPKAGAREEELGAGVVGAEIEAEDEA